MMTRRQLRAENKALKERVATLEDVVQRQATYIVELRKQAGHAPHDWEPCRPGLEDVD